jgi:hypothetical protein
VNIRDRAGIICLGATDFDYDSVHGAIKASDSAGFNAEIHVRLTMGLIGRIAEGQRFCNSFVLARSPLFFCRITRDFSGFHACSTIGRSGSFGRTRRYYQAQKQAQLITVCSWIAWVELIRRGSAYSIMSGG